MRNYPEELMASEEANFTLKTENAALKKRISELEKRVAELEQQVIDLKTNKPQRDAEAFRKKAMEADRIYHNLYQNPE